MKYRAFQLCKCWHYLSRKTHFSFTQCVRCYPGLPKRFYRKVDILNNGNNNFEITLDQRKLRTPGGQTFKLENETLALAVAAEWDSQENDIQTNSMHLTSLCNTVIDNPLHTNCDTLVPLLLNFLFTDVVLYHSEENEELHKLQKKGWSPVINTFNKKYNVNILPTTDISYSFVDDEMRKALKRHLVSYSLPCLQGLTFAAESLKSLILTMCCVEQEISVEKAVLLSRLEEEFQIEKWGRIEWAHDTNHADLLSRVSAAILFTRLNLESSTVKTK